MKMTRFLMAAAVAAMMVSCGGQSAPKAEAADAEEPAVAEELAKFDNMETRMIGDLKVTWIQDNLAPRKMAAELFGTPEELVKELNAADGFDASMSTFLVETDGKKILFDTGNGNEDSQLLPNLAKLGIQPADIDVLAITHMHGDHIGGMMKGEEVVFPNAQVYMTLLEHDFYMGQPADKAGSQQAVIAAYKDRLHLIQYGETIPGGFEALDAKGHTPGHVVFKNGKCLIIGDLMHGAALQVNHPEYSARFDNNTDDAVAARKKFMEMARNEGLVMCGMHLPAPAFMTLE